MFKQIALLKRNPKLSRQEFIDHYETVHVPIGLKYLKGNAVGYYRRYLYPIDDPEYGVAGEPEYDVQMELWFPDEETWRKTLALITSPEASAEIVADEEILFDRSKNRFFTVDERENKL